MTSIEYDLFHVVVDDPSDAETVTVVHANDGNDVVLFCYSEEIHGVPHHTLFDYGQLPKL